MVKEKLSESDYTYDIKFKQLFTNRVFLTPILKNIIPEYKECALEEIETLIQPHGDAKGKPDGVSNSETGDILLLQINQQTDRNIRERVI